MFQIVIEGVRGSDYQGDIAIDDFEWSPAACGIVPLEADPNYVKPTTMMPTTGPVTLPPGGCHLDYLFLYMYIFVCTKVC